MFIIFACVSVTFGRKTKRHIKLWMESLSVTIQMTASKEYVSVVPFFYAYEAVQTFESMDEILSVTIQPCQNDFATYTGLFAV